jgi:predicted DNA-binding WGR domain protein
MKKPSRLLRLERLDPSKNMMRYYTMQVTPGLFGDWCLVRSWGRIGSEGQARMEWYATREEAEDSLYALERVKRRKGYLEKL